MTKAEREVLRTTTRRRVETLWVAGGKRHIADPKAGTLCGWFPSKQHLDRMPEFEMGEYTWEGGKPPDKAPEGYCKTCWQWMRYRWECVSERVVAE